MVEARAAPLSRISRPGSTADLILDRMGVIQENMGAIPADNRNSIEAIPTDIGAAKASIIEVNANIDAVQAEIREVLGTVIHQYY